MGRLQQIANWLMLLGFLIALFGGIQVRGDPEGTWVRVGPLHVAGGLLAVAGLLLNVLAGLGIVLRKQERRA